MKIYLPTGECAIIDDIDYEKVCEYRWKRKIEPSGITYVSASAPHPRGIGQTTVLIHRIITGARKGMVVDHIDGNPLNNKRDNLRVVTDRDNIRSFQNKRNGKTSKYRGVHWSKYRSRWVASICIRVGKKMTHPYREEFDCENNAAIAFNKKATELGFSKEALNKVGST